MFLNAIKSFMSTMFYGTTQLLIGLSIICGIFLFFAAFIVPPIAAFEAFIENDVWYGTAWLIVSLYIYGKAFELS